LVFVGVIQVNYDMHSHIDLPFVVYAEDRGVGRVDEFGKLSLLCNTLCTEVEQKKRK